VADTAHAGWNRRTVGKHCSVSVEAIGTYGALFRVKLARCFNGGLNLHEVGFRRLAIAAGALFSAADTSSASKVRPNLGRMRRPSVDAFSSMGMHGPMLRFLVDGFSGKASKVRLNSNMGLRYRSELGVCSKH